MNISGDILSLIGNTPLVRIPVPGAAAVVTAKLEFFNPFGSSKDRVAAALINDGERRGVLKKGTSVIEATSGNTGIALAGVCAVKGYRLILTMPENMSAERIRLLKYLGATVVLTPQAQGMKGAVKKAEELAACEAAAYIPDQFSNPANPYAHEQTTAEEIWRDTAGGVDIVVCGIGTGGTVTGIARGLRKKNKKVTIIGVEPDACAVLSGKKAGPHAIQGIGAGFIPEVLDRSLLDEVITVTDNNALKTTGALASEQGLLAGISSGAAFWAAREVARRKGMEEKTIVVVFPDSGERYLSLLKDSYDE